MIQDGKRTGLAKASVIAFFWCFVLFAIYAPSIPGLGFTIDDYALIDIPQIHAPMSWKLLKTIFTPGNHIDYYPVRDLFYWIQVHLLGASASCMNMSVFRSVSLLLFGFILFSMTRILSRRGLSGKDAFFVVGLYAILPIHSEMLMWSSAQKDLLALAFSLAAADLLDEWWCSGSESARAWVAAFALFLAGLAGKATMILFPGVMVLAVCSRRLPLEGRRKHIAFAGSFIFFVTAVAWGLLQVYEYRSVNDMRLHYEFGYRVMASAAALGREALGVFWPPVNFVDVENWGSWLHFNRVYAPIGASLWAAWIALFIWVFRTRRMAWCLFLVGAVAIYLPTSGLVFRHRNFYSVRYFEPLLLYAWIFASIAAVKWWQRSSRPRILYAFLGGAILYFSPFSLEEGEVWAQASSVTRKGVKAKPESLQLRVHHSAAMSQDLQWGRLNPEEVAELKRIQSEVREACDPSSDRPHLEDCLSFWVMGFWNPEVTDEKMTDQTYLGIRNALAKLLADRVERFGMKRRILRISIGEPVEGDTPFEELIEESGFGTSALERSRILHGLCLLGKKSEAVARKAEYFEAGLLNASELNVSTSMVLDFLKKRGRPEQAESLRSCLYGHPR